MLYGFDFSPTAAQSGFLPGGKVKDKEFVLSTGRSQGNIPGKLFDLIASKVGSRYAFPNQTIAKKSQFLRIHSNKWERTENCHHYPLRHKNNAFNFPVHHAGYCFNPVRSNRLRNPSVTKHSVM